MESTYWVSYVYQNTKEYGFGSMSVSVDKKLSTQVMIDIAEFIKKGYDDKTKIIILSATKLEE